MFGLSLPESGIVAVRASVFFGASRLLQFGSNLWRAISIFRTALRGQEQHTGEIEKIEKRI